MSTKENKAVVRRLFDEIWTNGNMESAQEIIADDYESTDPTVRFHGINELNFVMPTGKRAIELERSILSSNVSNLQFEIQEMIVNKDTVITVWTVSGTSKTETFMTRGGQLRNKTLNTDGISVNRISDGKIKSNAMYWAHQQALFS